MISCDGMKPSADRIHSIVELPYPTSKKEVETFLGMVTYLGKFIPNLSETTAPLRELTQKGVAWHWNHEHAQAVDKLKAMIISAPVLQLLSMMQQSLLPWLRMPPIKALVLY